MFGYNPGSPDYVSRCVNTIPVLVVFTKAINVCDLHHFRLSVGGGLNKKCPPHLCAENLNFENLTHSRYFLKAIW